MSTMEEREAFDKKQREQIEQQSLKEILTNLCLHLGDIADQLNELNTTVEALNIQFEKVSGEHNTGIVTYGFIRTVNLE